MGIDTNQVQRNNTMNSKSPVIVEAKARAKPAKDADILGVTRHTSPVAPTIAAETRLNRTESHRLTDRKHEHDGVRSAEVRPHLPTSNSMDLSSIFHQPCVCQDKRRKHTVSTHRNISLRNLDEAPKARIIVTPEIVSP